ncbi:hypothetical protein N1851_029901 [Merluccius polli]|uniref:Uncharacterized protein n=1 Tax=Merluccius polli TaxID=89951 RepID=A0AA47NRC7_MERPO|nr:hypothetical protein N1851_029901 [Merluccius polli]
MPCAELSRRWQCCVVDNRESACGVGTAQQLCCDSEAPVSTAMEGVLEGACALGVCKLACSLFFLPAFSDLISFCCCCLLMFTDLLVTGFLLFLWFADPWPPQLSPRGDLIALRFLLFVGRTYAAVLLLTAPLIAAETALRKAWPCDDGGGAAPVPPAEPRTAKEKSDDARPPPPGAAAAAYRGPDRWRRLSHAIGYPCCLSVWMVSGLWGGCRGRSLEELWVAGVFTHKRLPLHLMFPGPVEPFWGVAFLGLLLLLSIAAELSARMRREKRGTGVAEDNNNNNNNESNSWQRLVPALVRPSPPTSEPRPATEPRSVDPEETSVTHQRPDPDPPAPESAPGDPDGPAAGRPQRVVPGTGRIVTTGLVGMLSLYTLPLTLSVNVLLVHTMQDVVEVCVETCVAQRRRRRGEAKASVLKTLPENSTGDTINSLAEIIITIGVLAHSVDAQRLHVLAVGVALAGAEVGEHLGGELVPVRVQPGHVVGVVEHQQPLTAVQEHAHLLQLALDVEARPRLGAGAVLVAVVHDDAVEAAAGLDLDAALAAHRLAGHAHHPLGLLRHRHLPVVDAAGEALGAQHRHLHVEAPRRVLQRLRVEVAVGHDGAVVRQDEALVGRDGVQGQRRRHCGEGGERFSADAVAVAGHPIPGEMSWNKDFHIVYCKGPMYLDVGKSSYVRRVGHALQEVMASTLVEALLQDLDALLHVAQLLTVALDFVLDVGQLARRVRLQLFQHALLPLAQEAVQALEGLADGGAQALGRGLKGGEGGG